MRLRSETTSFLEEIKIKRKLFLKIASSQTFYVSNASLPQKF